MRPVAELRPLRTAPLIPGSAGRGVGSTSWSLARCGGCRAEAELCGRHRAVCTAWWYHVCENAARPVLPRRGRRRRPLGVVAVLVAVHHRAPASEQVTDALLGTVPNTGELPGAVLIIRWSCPHPAGLAGWWERVKGGRCTAAGLPSSVGGA
jgi:hypothetical protein